MRTVLAGPVGLWTGTLDALPPALVREVVADLDAQGWGGLWFGEAYGREAFTNAAMMLGASDRLPVATGIANIYGRDAMAMAAAAKTVAAQFPGRFVCGMGVSHAPLVESMRGHTYAGPVPTMRAYLDAMQAAPFYAAAGEMPPVVLAALGPRMLELAAERTAGAHPYLITPEWTARTREIVGPEAEVAVMHAVALTDDAETWRRRAHDFLNIYTGLPNYRNSWLRQGFTEDDFVRGGSERLKEAMVVRGDESAVEGIVRAHLEAGASHVCLQVLGTDLATAPVEEWRRLGTALLS